MTNKSLNANVRGFFAGGRPRVMAHRGAAGEAPENTMVSFERAIAQGADILEMDVHLTADKRVVVCHDATLERTTNGYGLIAEKTLAEIRELDAGYRFTVDGGKTYPYRGKGVQIPTFSEVLAAFPDVPINFEIKDEDLYLVQFTMGLLEKHGRFKKSNVLIAGANHKLMDQIRLAAPSGISGHSEREVWRFVVASWLRMPSLYKGAGDAIQLPARTKANFKVVTGRLVRFAHKLGMEVHAWTVNDEAEIKRLLSLGVDGLFTDFPGKMREIVDKGNYKA